LGARGWGFESPSLDRRWAVEEVAPDTQREDERKTLTGEDLAQVEADQDEQYRAAWRAYMAPLRAGLEQ
jgi:predicted NBD/HSP70 family sugar kinase